jgi:AcrR family transcriptional regulator
MAQFTDRQKDFLNAAIEIVSRQGFSKLTIRNVARAVGVTEPAVYRHFPSKLALLTAMLEDLQSAMVPHFTVLRTGGEPPRKRFERFIRGLFEEFKKRPAYAPFIFSEEIFHSEEQLREKLQEVLKTNISILTRSFEALQEEGACRTDIEPREMALITLASIRLSVSRWHINSGKVRLKEMADTLISSFTTLFELQEGR